jgi:hypothetical protein
MVGLASLYSGAQLFKGVQTTLHASNMHPPGIQLLVQYFTVRRVVVDYKSPQTTDTGTLTRHCNLSCVFSLLELGGKPEGAASALLAFYLNPPPHEFYQPLGDDKSQTCAAIPASSCRACLRKRLEQAFLLLGHHANTGVLHLEADGYPLARLFYQPGEESNLSLFGELDSVTQ